MDLDEYIWRYKTTGVEIARKAGCSTNTIVAMKGRKHSPGLLLALKIDEITDGKVSLDSLLSKGDYEKLNKWLGD